jgi:hypothetical protein
MTAFILIVFVIYTAITIVIFMYNFLGWNDWRWSEDPEMVKATRESARQAILAPLWPILALEGLREMFDDAFGKDGR